MPLLRSKKFLVLHAKFLPLFPLRAWTPTWKNEIKETLGSKLDDQFSDHSLESGTKHVFQFVCRTCFDSITCVRACGTRESSRRSVIR